MVIVKHANPCGAGPSPVRSTRPTKKAFESDPTSAFRRYHRPERRGRRRSGRKHLRDLYRDPAGPGLYAGSPAGLLRENRNLRLLTGGSLPRPATTAKYVSGGLLLQDPDLLEDAADYQVVTRARPPGEQMQDLLFAWRVAKTVKSNAIVLAEKRAGRSGVGAGQMSRVESAGIAAKKAGARSRGRGRRQRRVFPFRRRGGDPGGGWGRRP